MKRKLLILLTVLLVGGAIYWGASRRPGRIVLTGIVATDQVIVSPQIAGQLLRLNVKEGDTVTNTELVAQLNDQQWQADVAFYASSEAQAQAQRSEAAADLENARLTFEREEGLYRTKVESIQAYDQARTAYDAAKARVESLVRQIHAIQAQKDKARVQLAYTEIRAPIGGIVDTRAALEGEVVNPGQAIITLIDQDNLWIRADVEETYIDSIHLGDTLTVRLPSGAERQGVVFYRGVDADYATQRDVSRTKRDIKTVAIRVRVPNPEGKLPLGMTAWVMLPVPALPPPAPVASVKE